MLQSVATSLRRNAAMAAGVATATATVAFAEKDKLKDYFDPEAYERAAKALKEIEKSSNAKQVR